MAGHDRWRSAAAGARGDSMTWFVLTILVVYGSVHGYVFLRLYGALRFSPLTAIPVVAFMLLMVLTPLTVHWLERRGYDTAAMVLAEIGYLWMGLVFLFFVVSIAIDGYRWILFAIQGLFGLRLGLLVPSPQQLFWIPLTVAAGIFLYAYHEAGAIKTEHLTVASDKIPADVRSLRVVQISDVHIGLMVRRARLEKILAEVTAAKPDLLVSTGDLLDGQTDRIDGMTDLLRAINPPYGKYAIMGNHEYYAGFSTSHLFFQRAGFTLLRGEDRKIAGCVTLVGFDDAAANRFGGYRSAPRPYRKGTARNGDFILFLRHQPVVDGPPGCFDLQLSGHTHCGQIFPFRYVTALFFPMNSGLFRLADQSLVYVSRGSGTWGPPHRFLAPPEITVIDLVPKPAAP